MVFSYYNIGIRRFKILDDINDTTASFSPSYRTKAGLSLAAVKSVKGNGRRTIFPFIYILP